MARAAVAARGMADVDMGSSERYIAANARVSFSAWFPRAARAARLFGGGTGQLGMAGIWRQANSIQQLLAGDKRAGADLGIIEIIIIALKISLSGSALMFSHHVCNAYSAPQCGVMALTSQSRPLGGTAEHSLSIGLPSGLACLFSPIISCDAAGVASTAATWHPAGGARRGQWNKPWARRYHRSCRRSNGGGGWSGVAAMAWRRRGGGIA